MNDIVINKIQDMQRFVRRARDVYQADPEGFAANDLRQDAALLNVLRACEAAIDLANHVIRVRKLGIPVSSADSFILLRAERIIEAPLAERIVKMVGFRNLVVHQYAEVDMQIVEAVIVSGLDDVLAFGDAIRGYADGTAS